MRQTPFKIQAKTCMSYLPFPPDTLFLDALLHCIFRRDLEVMSKTRASCFIRGSKHLETIKALGAFIVLSSVSRCLEPLMKHSHSFLIYYMKKLEKSSSISSLVRRWKLRHSGPCRQFRTSGVFSSETLVSTRHECFTGKYTTRTKLVIIYHTQGRVFHPISKH